MLEELKVRQSVIFVRYKLSYNVSKQYAGDCSLGDMQRMRTPLVPPLVSLRKGTLHSQLTCGVDTRAVVYLITHRSTEEM